MKPATIEDIQTFVQTHQKILIMQADNPDADSLASSLALEHILGDLGKEPVLYCGVDMPTYLRYLPGWDRVSRDIPAQFDASIIVDTSVITLFDNLSRSNQKNWVSSKPCLVIDHHAVEATIPFATLIYNQPTVATGEAIYELAISSSWTMNKTARDMIAISILSDSIGLMSEATSARSIHIIGELVESGVRLAELDAMRRELMRKSPELLAYKGRLLERVEYAADGRLALITIPWEEIQDYSHAYNPSMLVIDDMRLVERVDVAIAFKQYPDGKVTAKIRCNFGKAIADKLATHFGGGGHAYASGFKVTDKRSYNEIKQETIEQAAQLLDNLDT